MKKVFLIIPLLVLAFGCSNSLKPKEEPKDEPKDDPHEEVIEKEHEHSFGEWEIVTAPTCIQDGKEKQVCNCGQINYQKIKALGHDIVVVESKEATCTENGHDKYYECKRCGYKMNYNKIEAYGHNYIYDKCERCNDVLEETIGLQFEISSNNEYAIVVGLGSVKDSYINIPSQYNGLPVKEIKNFVFNYCEQLTYLIIPDSVEKIDAGSFINCQNLKEVFLPKNIKEIEPYTFSQCTSLVRIELPESITSIGKGAFSGCYSLENINIPKDCDTIGINFIENCYSLKNITVDENHKTLKAIDGNLFTKDGLTMIKYCNNTTDKTYTVPDGVTYISDGCFFGSSLVSVILPQSVKVIGKSAFESCKQLTEIKFEEGLEAILERAFLGCEMLSSITLPETLITLDEYAFSNCTSLKSINIPNNLENINIESFDNCISLANISVDENNQLYKIVDGLLCTKDGKELVIYPLGKTKGKIVIPEGVEVIRDLKACFTYDTLEIILPNSIKEVNGLIDYYPQTLKLNKYDNGLYLGNSQNPYLVLLRAKSTDITSCEINENCKVIASCAFSNCENLKNVKMSNNCIKISNSAFSNCSSLESIEIPSSVTKIDNFAFGECRNLKTVILHENLIEISAQAFYECSSLKNITLPKTLEVIGREAFSGCASLTSITIPDNIKMIESTAFLKCNNLLLNEYENALYLGSETNPYMFLYSAKDTLIETCLINSRCMFIASSAFYSCARLSKIEIPNGIEIIDERTFSRCSNLTEIVIPSTVKTIGNSAFSHLNNDLTIKYSGSINEWLCIKFEGYWAVYVYKIFVEGEGFSLEI